MIGARRSRAAPTLKSESANAGPEESRVLRSPAHGPLSTRRPLPRQRDSAGAFRDSEILAAAEKGHGVPAATRNAKQRRQRDPILVKFAQVCGTVLPA